MRQTCPFLLGALLIALICLGGGLHTLDQLLMPVTAWIAGSLPSGLGAHYPATAGLALSSRELAPVAATVCLALGPLFDRWSSLAGALILTASSAGVLLAAALASHAGALVLPGALLAAALLALIIGTLTRLASAADSAAAVPGDPDAAALMPALAEQSTAAILVFDSDGCIRSCNRAFGDMFGCAPADLVGTSFGRLLDVPDQDQPRLFRRSDGPVRVLIARRQNGQRIHLQAALSTLEWRGDRLRVAILHDVSEVRADQELLALTDDATGLCNHVLFYDRIEQAILAADRAQQPTAVLVIHLNLFKLIADTLGEPFAHELIALLIGRIQEGGARARPPGAGRRLGQANRRADAAAVPGRGTRGGPRGEHRRRHLSAARARQASPRPTRGSGHAAGATDPADRRRS
jgi:PAS domain S-box-containing protein